MAQKEKKQYYLNNPNLPTAGAQFEYTPEMIKEIKKCKDTILHFAEKYFFIINLDEGRQVIKLHSYQRRVLRKMRDERFFVLLSSRQIGKALALDTPIITPNGWTTMGELKDGDVVYGINGKPCNVTHAHDVLHGRDCYEVEFDNGEKIIADEDHQWFTQTKVERNHFENGSVKTTKDIFDTTLKYNEPNHRIPSCIAGIEHTEKELPVDPYMLGLWLGDGTTATGTFTVGERDFSEIYENLKQYGSEFDIYVKYYSSTHRTASIRLKHLNNGLPFCKILQAANLINNKHIPEIYFRSSREQRLHLLKGLIDSDGYITKSGTCQFYNTNIDLTIQVKELIESLGYKTTYKTLIPKLYGKECTLCGVVTFFPRELVTTLKFKSDRIKLKDITTPQSKNRNHWYYIKNVKKVDSVPVRCITVDSSDNLFLCGRMMIPTHNSTLLTIYALWLMCFNNDQRVVIVANKEATAIEIFKRVRMAYEELPNWLKPGIDEWGKTSIKMSNGSEASISTTTGSAIRGMSINCVTGDSTITLRDVESGKVINCTMEHLKGMLNENIKTILIQ